jgi:hypothetical protein
MNRRTLFGSLAGWLPGSVAMPATAKSALLAAIDDFREARDRLDRVERSYARHASEWDCPADYDRLRALESDLGVALRASADASAAVVAALDRSDLAGVSDWPEVFVVAELKPEGVRRLVVVRTSRLDLSGR